MMMGMLPLIFALMFSQQMGNDLIDYLHTDTYWKIKGVTVEARSMLKELAAPAPAGRATTKLIKDLGSSSFQKREAATAQLRAMGKAALPQLKNAAASDDVEVSVRARKLVVELSRGEKDTDIRRLMAIRTLGELSAKSSLPVLKRLLASKRPFESDYAQAAIAAIQNKPYQRPEPSDKEMGSDLACLPDGCALAAQLKALGGRALDFDALIKSISPMIGMGFGRGGSQPDIKLEATKAVLTVAEMIGNVRISGVTVGLANDIGDNNGFVSVIVNGTYDPVAVRAALAGFGAQTKRVGPVSFLFLDDEFMFAPVSTHRFACIMGPGEQAFPLKDYAAALTARSPKLRLNDKLKVLINKTDTSCPLWGTVVMTDAYKKITGLTALDTVSLTARQAKDVIAIKLVASGDDAQELRKLADTTKEGIKTALVEVRKAMNAGAQGMMPMKEMMAPALAFLESIKFDDQDKVVAITGKLKGSSSSFLAAPAFLFFGVFSMRSAVRAHAMPMPHLEVPPPDKPAEVIMDE